MSSREFETKRKRDFKALIDACLASNDVPRRDIADYIPFVEKHTKSWTAYHDPVNNFPAYSVSDVMLFLWDMVPRRDANV